MQTRGGVVMGVDDNNYKGLKWSFTFGVCYGFIKMFFFSEGVTNMLAAGCGW